ncbi:hypothetical protein TNCV_3522761 [Trichonephila clavipes]|uniref:Uncharacterized protein n=1 Tax=Trichonephila clavipes TaxID=2585209 RepID=A0A8X7BGP8_TRICX|nr:hypothetical protein TNCV_3522761 [Trichonephila clavipes]
MLKHLSFDVFEPQGTKLPVRLINEHSRTRGHETTPLMVQGDIEDVFTELDNEGYRLHFLDETPKILLLSGSYAPNKLKPVPDL